MLIQTKGSGIKTLSNEDIAYLNENGITPEEAQRQLELLIKPAYYAKLERACTDLDGIISIDSSKYEKYLSLHHQAESEGRFVKFVPASGAATRMFQDLMCILERSPAPTYSDLNELAQAGAKDAKAVLKFLANLNNYAFFAELQKLFSTDLNELKQSDQYIEIIQQLLLKDGLNYSEQPKGLLPFHLYEGMPRTAFEEHLVEAALTVRNRSGLCKLHFTVSPEHMADFKKLFLSKKDLYEKKHGVHFDVSFSIQKKSTNMLALDADNKPFRDDNGRIMLRPGGHGSLIENLSDLKSDIIFIKNIDNVQPDHDKETTLKYKKVLAGYLIETQEKVFGYLHQLQNQSLLESDLDNMASFARNELQIDIQKTVWNDMDSEQKRLLLIKKLNRPIRVCGMVRNTGEPGGGPFWIREDDNTLGIQIVEGAQVNLKDSEQAALFRNSTHFNPVDLVCSYKDFSGNHFDLHEYINNEAVIKTEKSYRGRKLTASERPGLWNGAMSNWITLFIDVPESTFTPVKTVLDLLRK